MFASAAIFLSIVQVTWDEALIQYPVQSLLVMAVSMTVPMLAWMRHRRHDWKRSTEMGAATVVPVIPFICLVLFDVTRTGRALQSLLRRDHLGHARRHVLPPQRLLRRPLLEPVAVEQIFDEKRVPIDGTLCLIRTVRLEDDQAARAICERPPE